MFDIKKLGANVPTLSKDWIQILRIVLVVYLGWLIMSTPSKPIFNYNTTTKVLFIMTLLFVGKSDLLSALLLMVIFFLSSQSVLPMEGFANSDSNENTNTLDKLMDNLDDHMEDSLEPIDMDNDLKDAMTTSNMDQESNVDLKIEDEDEEETDDVEEGFVDLPQGYNYDNQYSSF